MNRSTKLQIIAIVIGGLMFMGLIVLGAFIKQAEAEELERDTLFQGACLALDGEIKEDVCIADGVVVLTQDEFEEKAGK